MGAIVITAIQRNDSSPSQLYKVQYKRTSDVDWADGPTLTWNQAASGSGLPLTIPIPDAWVGEINVRIATICRNQTTQYSSTATYDIVACTAGL